MDEDKEKKEGQSQRNVDDKSRSSAWNPDDGIVLEWWGRAEGLDDNQ